MSPRPLDDVTIVEVASFMAAPSSAAIMADLGADVIKIEPLGGDPGRGVSRRPRLGADADPAKVGFDYQFDVTNRGKRSVAVDLRTEDGQAVIHRIVAQADVFLTNLLPARQAKYRLDPESLKAANSQIVHATLTGYGTEGPEAARPGYDITAFFGRSGLSSASRDGEDANIPWAPTAQGDYTTGLAVATSMLAALRLAERTGQAQVVETSLFETGVWTQACDLSIMAVERKRLRPRPRAQRPMATINSFRCADGEWLVINMPQVQDWPVVAAAVGREELVEDERFDSPRNRFYNMEELVAEMDTAFLARTRDEWGELFDEVGVVWGPVLGLHEVVDDPQAEAIGLFPHAHNDVIGDYRTVASPIRFHTAEVKPGPSAPTAGEHTAEVLLEAGFSGADLDKLQADGVVGTASEAAGNE